VAPSIAPPAVAPPVEEPAEAPVVDIPMPDLALTAESALLDEAQEHLAAGRHRAALETLAAHRVRFPNGRLIQERDVIGIRALVAAGQLDAAREQARRFMARHPKTAFRHILAPILGSADR